MKKQILIIHGGHTFASQENFVDYLKSTSIDLFEVEPRRWSRNLQESLGDEYEVIAPLMPCKQNAKYEHWKIWFERHLEFIRDDVIVMGWSLGGIFIAKYLSENKLPVRAKAVYLFAAVVPVTGADDDFNDLTDFNFDLQALDTLSKQTAKVYIYHSKDDFVVPYSHALQYHAALPEAELVTFEDRNHFLQPDFPEVIASVKQLG